MKIVQVLFLTLLLTGTHSLSSQTGMPEDDISREEVKAHLFFLASDELAGRRTGSPGITIAANYLASHFASLGLEHAPGLDSYFQDVPYAEVTPTKEAQITLEKQTFVHGDDMLLLTGPAMDEKKIRYVFAGYGLVDPEEGRDDYAGLDVKGKIVVTYLGLPGNENPAEIFGSLENKRKWATERGAIGLIELYRLRFPWSFVKNFFNKDRIELADSDSEAEDGMIYGWIHDKGGKLGEELTANGKGKMSLKSDGSKKRLFTSPNVIAYLPGTDPVLRNEYVILSAHYDHVGVGEQGGGKYTEEDSIFNGARDNAFGTVALLMAAKSLRQQPLRRSVIFVAYSGEELGLLGSRYYADHPVVPLRQTVLNLNTDGAGYNETDAISIIGYGRMDLDAELDSAARAFGLRVIANPAPDQNLFDRSDNVSLAIKGVPAPCFSPGLSSFNRAISKYYHQVTDNPETVDLDYLRVFTQAYTHAARLLGNRDKAPQWLEGDKYAPAADKLYGPEEGE